MPPTIRTGALGSAGTFALNPDQLVVEMDDDVFQYDPPNSPMLTIATSRLTTKMAHNPKVQHLEDDVVTEWDTLAASATSGATTITVAFPQIHRPGDILRVVSTGETLRILAVNEGTAVLDVARSWGATAASAIGNGAAILNMGAGEMEGDLSPQAKQTITVTKFNFQQIMKEAVHITRTAQNTKNYGGDERNRQRRKAGAKHARDWEQVLFHGEKNEDLTGAYPVRTAGGLDEHITTNVLAAGGVLTETEFNNFIGDCMRYSVRPGRTTKLLFASRPLMGAISAWAAAKLQTNSQASAKYGIRVTHLITPYGELDIVNHPLLEVGYAGTGYIVDPDGVRWRPSRRTQLETNIQANGEDAWKDQYITEATFQFALEKSFGKITGVTN
jgi:hypothetical protein